MAAPGADRGFGPWSGAPANPGQQQPYWGGAPPPPGAPPQQFYPSSPQPPYGGPPQQWGPPPQHPSQWGAQPQQQWGGPTPPPPQQQWGGPPPGAPGAPQGQWGGAPPMGPGGMYAPGSVVFRFSGSKSGILNSEVVDQFGRPVFRIKTDKHTTDVLDYSDRTIAHLRWWDHGPKIKYHDHESKVKEWIPLTKEKHARHLQHNGQEYTWVEENRVCLLQAGPGHTVAIWHNEIPDRVEVEVFPEAVQKGLVDPVLLTVMLMACDRPIGDVKKKEFKNEWIPAIVGAL